MGKTVIIGATPNPSRYAYVAAKLLQAADEDFVPLGIKSGSLFGREIIDIRLRPRLEDVHTITLYIGPPKQQEWYDYLLSLNPNRIIFNPGTENHELSSLAKKNGIEVENACTLVLIKTGRY